MINSYYLIVQGDIDTFHWTEKGKNVSVTNEILLLYLSTIMSKKRQSCCSNNNNLIAGRKK